MTPDYTILSLTSLLGIKSAKEKAYKIQGSFLDVTGVENCQMDM